jgi:hypothetical protein
MTTRNLPKAGKQPLSITESENCPLRSLK